MKKVLKNLIVLFFCLFMCTGCDLKDIIKDLLATTSSSSQQIGGENITSHIGTRKWKWIVLKLIWDQVK